MSEFIHQLSPHILKDWLNSACGKKLGGGVGRQVFVYDLNPKFVIKVEEVGFQNVIEWEFWHQVKDTRYAKWFAAARHISGLGTILLMDRTLPAPRSNYPKRMPVFLGDYKYSNYGLLRGQLVCHDYGQMSCVVNGLDSKMRKANWWDANDGSSFDDRAKT